MSSQSLSPQQAVSHVFDWQQHRDLPDTVRNIVSDVSNATGLMREDHVDMVINAIEKLDAPANLVEPLIRMIGTEGMHILFDYLHECGISTTGLLMSQDTDAFVDLAQIIDLLDVDGALSLYIKLGQITGSKNPNEIGFHKLLTLVREYLVRSEEA